MPLYFPQKNKENTYNNKVLTVMSLSRLSLPPSLSLSLLLSSQTLSLTASALSFALQAMEPLQDVSIVPSEAKKCKVDLHIRVPEEYGSSRKTHPTDAQDIHARRIARYPRS